MADYKHFRIFVDLSAFFYDHRRTARVFVKKNLRSIVDLQNRISEIFEISEFYLTTGGQFLPASEDIRVLSNNESVCVIPNKPQDIALQPKLNVTLTPTEHKKHKRPLDSIPEQSDEASTPRPKKSKNKHYVMQGSDEDEMPCKKKKSEKCESVFYDNNYSEVAVSSKKKKKSEKSQGMIVDWACSTDSSKKKVKQNGRGTDIEHVNPGCDEKILPNKTQDQSIVERQICNIESSQRIIDVKKKLKLKADEFINKHSKDTLCKMDAPSNIKNVLPKLQSHIKSCNDLGRSNLPDTVRLSRHVDTPIKTFNRYIAPPRITEKYLAKNRINIVKIDVVKKGNGDYLVGQANTSQSSVSNENADISCQKSMENSNISQHWDESPPKNYVKEVINTFETNISPDLKNNISEEATSQGEETALKIKENEASNYTKAFLDASKSTSLNSFELTTDVDVNINEKLPDVSSVSSTVLNGLNDQEGVLSQVLKAEDFPSNQPSKEESSSMPLNISSIDQNTSYNLTGISQELPLNSTNTSFNLNDSSRTSRYSATSKRFGGVGSLLDRLRESDSLISHESDASTQNITQRKRIRKRKRKSKKTNEERKSASEKVENYDVKPMNVIACPSVHIKFEDNEMDILEDKSLRISDVSKSYSQNASVAENCTINTIEESPNGNKLATSDKNENKSLSVETLVLSDENDDVIMENKSIFGDQSIECAPLMTDILEPKVGDVIAFKIIKLTEDYTPEVSNYIVGKLETYLLESKTLYFKVIRGEEEFVPPAGKLSLTGETDVQNFKYKELLWTDLIAPKLFETMRRQNYLRVTDSVFDKLLRKLNFHPTSHESEKNVGQLKMLVELLRLGISEKNAYNDEMCDYEVTR